MNRRHRLRGRGRFTALRSTSVEVRRAGLRLRVAENGLGVSRVGLAVVGARNAVERNLMRRRLRAAVGPLVAREPGRDALLSVPIAWIGRAFKEVANEVDQAWRLGEQRLLDLRRIARRDDLSADNGGPEGP